MLINVETTALFDNNINVIVIVEFVIVIVVIGVILWLVNAYIPMDAKIKQILNIVVVIALVIWLLSLFIGGIPNIHIGR